MRNLLTAIVLLFTFSSFTGAPSIQSTQKLQRIIYDGCFTSGGVTVIVSYLPNRQEIVDVVVYGSNTSYAVDSYSPSSTIYNVGSTLYATYFTVYYIVPGSGTHAASWSGELSSSCY